MNSPQFHHKPKVIIQDLRPKTPNETQVARSRSMASEEMTIINRPIPQRIEPKKQSTNLVIGTTIGATITAILLTAGAVLYSTKSKSIENKSTETSSLKATSSATTLQTGNPLPPTPDIQVPKAPEVIATNAVPTPSADPELTNNPLSENSSSPVPVSVPAQSNKPWPNKAPLPRKSDIMRETPF